MMINNSQPKENYTTYIGKSEVMWSNSKSVWMDIRLAQDIYNSLTDAELKTRLFLTVYQPKQEGWKATGPIEKSFVDFFKGGKLSADAIVYVLKHYPARMDLWCVDNNSDVEYNLDAVVELTKLIAKWPDKRPTKFLKNALRYDKILRKEVYKTNEYKDMVNSIGCPVCLYGNDYPHYLVEPLLKNVGHWNFAVDNYFGLSKEDQIQLFVTMRNEGILFSCLSHAWKQISNPIISQEVIYNWSKTLDKNKMNMLRDYANKGELDMDLYFALSGETVGSFALNNI